MRKIFFLPVVLLLLVLIHQTSLLGGVKPGIYNVTIKANSIEITRDTWVFSENGKFESKGFGIRSKWENYNNRFLINAEKQKIKDVLKKYYKLMGFSTSGISISIKNVEISGISKGNTIKGNIETNFSIKIKKPIKTTFTTSGNMSFNGSL